MRVLVTGGRDYLDVRRVFAGLDRLHDAVGGITEIIEGGASGADIRAQWWAEREQIPCTEMKADWEKHGKAAGYIRNREMADLKPDLVLACPGGKGTANMIAIAKERGIRVVYLEKIAQPFPGPVVHSLLNL
jgi:hypothetical protein